MAEKRHVTLTANQKDDLAPIQKTLEEYGKLYSIDLTKDGEHHPLGKIWKKGNDALYLMERQGEVGFMVYTDAVKYLETGLKAGQDA